MFQDSGGLPIGGSALLAVFLWAGLSFFVTGPMIGARMAEKADWGDMCKAHIRTQMEIDIPPPAPVPDINLCGTLFGMFGREGKAYCDMHGQHFDLPFGDVMNSIQDSKRQAQEQLMSMAAERAGSRCDCAVTSTLEKRRAPFAIYAGTLRLVTPPSVKAFTSDLKSNLNAPLCAQK